MRQQLDDTVALLPIVRTLQNTCLQPVHWQRLQALLSEVQIGPDAELTLEQLIAIKVCPSLRSAPVLALPTGVLRCQAAIQATCCVFSPATACLHTCSSAAHYALAACTLPKWLKSLATQVMQRAEDICAVGAEATQDAVTEVQLAKLAEDYARMEVPIQPLPDQTEVFMLGNLGPCQAGLEDCLATAHTVLSLKCACLLSCSAGLPGCQGCSGQHAFASCSVHLPTAQHAAIHGLTRSSC